MVGIDGDSGTAVARRVAELVTDVPDFPQPGVVFKDLTPLFADPAGFREAIDAIVAYHGAGGFDVVAGIEARGFVIAAAVAYAAGTGVVPIRKAGKLPRAVLSAPYALEYGEAVLEVHEDAFAGGSGRGGGVTSGPGRGGGVRSGQNVLVVDDVLATGGTAAATLGLVERAGGVVVGFSVLLELAFLAGRQRLPDRPVHALLTV
jgi:adenine phosphoribosyltransferase